MKMALDITIHKQANLLSSELKSSRNIINEIKPQYDGQNIFWPYSAALFIVTRQADLPVK